MQSDLLIWCEAVPPFEKNGFVLACESTRAGVLIDPGDEVDRLLAIVAREAVRIEYILLTHAHMDHVSGVARAKVALGAPIGLHRDDHFLYQGAVQQALAFGFRIEQPPPVDFFYEGQGPYTFGCYQALVHHTPGHCPGGVCLQVGRIGEVGRRLFVGDTLFAGSIGRTDLPGGDHDTLMRSIRDVLFRFGDDAEVYPGHGPKTTIARERATNPFLVS